MDFQSRERNMPCISVIVPAHNAARTIFATLQHVVEQTYRNLDIIVVDDGSSDDTGRIVEVFAARDSRVIHLRQAQSGVAAARNLALATAKGDLVAPLDADDIWHPAKIERQVEAFRAAPADCGLVYCHARTIDGHDRIIGDVSCPAPAGYVHPYMLNSNFIRCSSIPLVRRDLLEQVGGYDQSLRARGAEGAEDFSLYLRLAEISTFACVDEFLVGYRQMGTNMSNRIKQNLNSWHIVLEETRERHPELPGWLYRWAAGNFHRWLGLRALAGGDLGNGTRLLFRALSEDPGGTLKQDVVKASISTALAVGAGALGVRRQARHAFRTVKRQSVDATHVEQPSFLDVDPRVALTAPVPWEVRRMKTIAHISATASGSRRKIPAADRSFSWLDPQEQSGAQAERP